MQWMWTEEEIAIHMEDLDILLETVKLGEQEAKLRKEEDWNMEMGILKKEKESKEEMRTIII